MRSVSSLLPFILLSACATTQTLDNRTTERDPLEKFNRGVWGVNQAIDKVALKPAASVYRTITPKPARRGLSHIFANLEEPWSFVNNLLQAKPKRAIRNLGRFVVNTTIGIGGLADHASKLGIRDSPEDFGQTLAVWGVKSGPYLVLPLLGPSTLRDGAGSVASFYGDPWRICLDKCTDLSRWAKFGIGAAQVVVLRSDATEAGADAFLKTSLDPYAAARSAWYQSRRAAIRDDEDASNNAPSGGTGTAGAQDSTGDAGLDAAVSDLKSQAGETPEQPAPAQAPPVPEPPKQPTPQQPKNEE